MLKAGHSVHRVAHQLGVSQSTLWRYTREGLLPASQCPARRHASATAESESGLTRRPRWAAVRVTRRGAWCQPGGAGRARAALRSRLGCQRGRRADRPAGVAAGRPAAPRRPPDAAQGLLGATLLAAAMGLPAAGPGAQRRASALPAARRVGRPAGSGSAAWPGSGARTIRRPSPRCSSTATCRSTAGRATCRSISWRARSWRCRPRPATGCTRWAGRRCCFASCRRRASRW